MQVGGKMQSRRRPVAGQRAEDRTDSAERVDRPLESTRFAADILGLANPLRAH